MANETSLVFYIEGTNLYYSVPDGVVNAPVFEIVGTNLILTKRGFLASNAVLTLKEDGHIWLSYVWTDEIYSEIFEQVRMLLGTPPEEIIEDRLIIYWIYSVERLIKNYCNMSHRDPIPEELFYVWVELVATKIQANRESFGIAPTVQSISSITDGSQSMGFAYAASTPTMSSTDQSLLTGYTEQLKRHRRLRWD